MLVDKTWRALFLQQLLTSIVAGDNQTSACLILLAYNFETTYGAYDYETSASAVPPLYSCQNHYCGYVRT